MICLWEFPLLSLFSILLCPRGLTGPWHSYLIASLQFGQWETLAGSLKVEGQCHLALHSPGSLPSRLSWFGGGLAQFLSSGLRNPLHVALSWRSGNSLSSPCLFRPRGGNCITTPGAFSKPAPVPCKLSLLNSPGSSGAVCHLFVVGTLSNPRDTGGFGSYTWQSIFTSHKTFFLFVLYCFYYRALSGITLNWGSEDLDLNLSSSVMQLMPAALLCKGKTVQSVKICFSSEQSVHLRSLKNVVLPPYFM